MLLPCLVLVRTAECEWCIGNWKSRWPISRSRSPNPTSSSYRGAPRCRVMSTQTHLNLLGLHSSLAAPLYSIINCSFSTKLRRMSVNQMFSVLAQGFFGSALSSKAPIEPNTVQSCHFEKRWASRLSWVQRMGPSTCNTAGNRCDIVHDPSLLRQYCRVPLF